MLNRTIVANLVDVFHMSIDDIGNLTPFQIAHIYFHPRKKSGELEPVNWQEATVYKRSFPSDISVDSDIDENIEEIAEPKSLRWKEYHEAYAVLFNMMQHKNITKEDWQETVKKLQEKFSDLFEKKEIIEEVVEEVTDTYQENYNKLLTYHRNGMLSLEQFNESVEQLKRNLAK